MIESFDAARLQRLYPAPAEPAALTGLYLRHALHRRSQPFVYANFIASLDGRVALADRQGALARMPSAIQERLSREGFTVGGMAKGAGMIHPVLATMLAVVTTDYQLGPGEAIDFLRPAVDESFNRISVDGECSTNDAVILLANDISL